MGILNVKPLLTGVVGVVPSIIFIDTNDTVAEVTATGYLNPIVQTQGQIFNESMMALVSTVATPGAAPTVSWLEVSKSGENWSLAESSTPISSVTLSNTGLKVYDTNASHTLTWKPGSNLTDNRTFTLVTGDADRSLTLAANTSVSAYGATLVDDADKFAALATLGLKAGLTSAYGGGGTSHAFTATGVVGSDLCFCTVSAQSNAAAIVQVVPGTDALTVTFSADPGAGTVLFWFAFPTV